MDIFSHGLWAGVAAKAANRRVARRINPWAAALWGVFPDLFAFAIPFLWLIMQIASGDMSLRDFGPPEAGNMEIRHWSFLLAQRLYSFSHSLIVFSAVFAAVWLAARRPAWELGGWMLHILMDVPTHTNRFFPTPVLWPVSEVTFNGFSWTNPVFLLVNYGLILAAFLFLSKKIKKDPI